MKCRAIRACHSTINRRRIGRRVLLLLESHFDEKTA